MCDVNENNLGAALSKSAPKARSYKDFRDFYEKLDDIDAVVVATPDHWHVPIAMAAARAGKDAYVEKPLGLTIDQNIACRKLFREKKRIFQYGTQQRSMDHCRTSTGLGQEREAAL